MEKTKFIRVAVEERLPDEELLSVLTNIGKLFVFDVEKSAKWWLLEIPDREDEMLQMLEELKSSHSELFRRLNQANNVYKIKTPSIENALENASKIIEKYSQNEDNEKLIQSVKQPK